MLREDQEGDDAPLVQVGEQLVHLQQQMLVAGHGLQIGVEAVDHHHAGLPGLDGAAHHVGELSWRHLGRIERLDLQPAIVQKRLDVQTQCLGPQQQCAQAFVEQVIDGPLAALQGSTHAGDRRRGFANPRRSREQGVAATSHSAAKQAVQFRRAGADHLGQKGLAVFGRHQPRKHVQAPGIEVEIVGAAAKRNAAHLGDAQVTPLGTVLAHPLIQADHAVRNAVQLQVVLVGASIVQHQHRAAPGREETLECQHLAPVAQRVLRQDPQLRQTVENDTLRLEPVHRRHHAPRGLTQFDFRGVQDGLFRGRTEFVLGHQLEHFHAIEGPAVGCGHRLEFERGLRKRDVEPGFTVLYAAAQKLQAQRRLAGAGRAFDQVKVLGREAAAQDVVETSDAGRGAFLFRQDFVLRWMSHGFGQDLADPKRKGQSAM